MSTLVMVEHNNQVMHPVNRYVLSAAQQLGEDVVLMVVGYQCKVVAEEAAVLEGVKKVIFADDRCYEHQLAENLSQLIVSLADNYHVIMAPSGTYGKNLLPRVAAMLDVGQVTDVTRVIDKNTFEHPIYAGNAIETVRVLDDKKVLSIRSTAFSPVQSTQSACVIEKVDNIFALENVSYIGSELSQSKRPELSQAKIIVSGGRGLQNRENFKLIEQLADTLGAAIGASRAAVDAGFVSNDYQVGQTGKVVAPQLYIAIGISGAIQHLAGMKDAKIIVAINKDEDAPMMKIANYALAGDLFQLVPQLIEQLQQRKV